MSKFVVRVSRYGGRSERLLVDCGPYDAAFNTSASPFEWSAPSRTWSFKTRDHRMSWYLTHYTMLWNAARDAASEALHGGYRDFLLMPFLKMPRGRLDEYPYSEEVYKQLEFIRCVNECSMLDRTGVEDLSTRCGFESLTARLSVWDLDYDDLLTAFGMWQLQQEAIP